MNRRKFLKRIAAVAAGAVAVPTVMKQLPCRPGLQKYKLIAGRWDEYLKYYPGCINRHVMSWNEFALESEQYRYRHYKILEGEYYANNSKNNLRHTTQ